MIRPIHAVAWVLVLAQSIRSKGGMLVHPSPMHWLRPRCPPIWGAGCHVVLRTVLWVTVAMCPGCAVLIGCAGLALLCWVGVVGDVTIGHLRSA